MSNSNEINFSTLLASTAHDMKNSLTMIVTTIDDISNNLQTEKTSSTLGEPLDLLRYEAKRVNNDLMTLLTLYKLESEHIALKNDINIVYDLLEEQFLHHQASLNYNNIETIIECDELLQWVFDFDLLGSVINNVINNALRYTKHKLKLSASILNEQLRIIIEDDGPGYPAHMLEARPERSMQTNLKTDSTSLGLYFSQTIAEAHHNKNTKGAIEISNNSSLGGGHFAINIPKI